MHHLLFNYLILKIKPAFGVAELELKDRMRNGVIAFNPSVDGLLREGHLLIEQVRQSDVSPVVNVLIEGKV
jgi:vesicle-fusing ATPase